MTIAVDLGRKATKPTKIVYRRELAPGAISLAGDRAQGDDSKHDLHYTKGLMTLGFGM